MPSAQQLPRSAQQWLADALEQALAEAATLRFAAEDQLSIVGRGVRVRYADTATAGFLGRAIHHLRRAPAGPPALTIECWCARDSSPAPPEGWPSLGTVHIDDGTVVVNWDASDGTLRAYDRANRRAWTRFSDPAAAAVREPVGPFRFILYWWTADCGLQLTHAATVGRDHGGVMLVGRSGSGKSTTALACLAAGLDFAGDDSCVIEPGDQPWVHGVYLTAKGDPRAATLLPTFADAFAQPAFTLDDESVIFADHIRPERISRGFPLLGIVVPELSGESASRLRPIGPAAALRALAPSTLLQVPDRDRVRSLARLASITEKLPAWQLTIGPDPAQAAELISGLIDAKAST